MVNLNVKTVKEFKDGLELLRYVNAHPDEVKELVELSKKLAEM